MQHLTDADASRKSSCSHILEMYTHRMNDYELRVKSLQKRLDLSLQQESVNAQEMAVQTLEFARYNSLLGQLACQEERLISKCDELRCVADVNSKALQQMNNKLETKNLKSARDLRDFEQRLAISTAEVDSEYSTCNYPIAVSPYLIDLRRLQATI